MYLKIYLATVLALYFAFLKTDGGAVSNETNYLFCADFGQIENARIQLVTHQNILHYQILHIECNIGYELIGRAKIVCNNGIWDPEERPRCESRLCDPPPGINYGTVQVDGKQNDLGKYEKGSFAVYTCDKDFTVFPPESEYRVCEMGIWTGSSGECVSTARKKVGCKRPSDIPNGYFVIENESLEHTFDVGQRIHYSCNPGYSVVPGETTVQQCLGDGSWSPKLQPDCLKLGMYRIIQCMNIFICLSAHYEPICIRGASKT